MSQHDYIIDNQLAPAFRADLNAALGAVVTQNSGTTAPTTTYANMLWYDTTNDLLKIRNEANSAWITVGTVDQTNNVFNPNFLPATQAEAEAGTDNLKGITSLRVAQAIIAQVGVANFPPVKNAINASGSAPIYACRAWVNFDGTTGTIRASGNVSSVTRNGTGNYTVNFTTAMPDVNYAVTATANDVGVIGEDAGTVLHSTTAVRIRVVGSGGTANKDVSQISVSVFR